MQDQARGGLGDIEGDGGSSGKRRWWSPGAIDIRYKMLRFQANRNLIQVGSEICFEITCKTLIKVGKNARLACGPFDHVAIRSLKIKVQERARSCLKLPLPCSTFWHPAVRGATTDVELPLLPEDNPKINPNTNAATITRPTTERIIARLLGFHCSVC